MAKQCHATVQWSLLTEGSCGALAQQLRRCYGDECLSEMPQLLPRIISAAMPSFPDLYQLCENATATEGRAFCSAVLGKMNLCDLYHGFDGPLSLSAAANAPFSPLILAVTALVLILFN